MIDHHRRRLTDTGKQEKNAFISVFCRHCQRGFCVCRCCWRGQAYCCNACRLSAGRASHREAQRRYRQTEKGPSQWVISKMYAGKRFLKKFRSFMSKVPA